MNKGVPFLTRSVAVVGAAVVVHSESKKHTKIIFAMSSTTVDQLFVTLGTSCLNKSDTKQYFMSSILVIVAVVVVYVMWCVCVKVKYERYDWAADVRRPPGLWWAGDSQDSVRRGVESSPCSTASLWLEVSCQHSRIQPRRLRGTPFLILIIIIIITDLYSAFRSEDTEALSVHFWLKYNFKYHKLLKNPI